MSRPTHVALLRGLNVGGRNALPMPDLVTAFEAAGATDVRTYIQSGNVVYRAPAGTARTLPDAVRARLATAHGLETTVITRTARAFDALVAANPFVAAGEDPRHLHVALLARKPSRAAVARLDPARSPGDAFAVVGSEVHLHLPRGVARTRLTNAWLDATLGTVSTVRSWRTVLRLRDMLAAD